jgi:hypothetical protein
VISIVVGVLAAADDGRQRPTSAVSRVEASSDIAWLERVASSAEAAREAQGESRVGQPKALRIAAYARLGALGTPDSLAAIERVERTLSAQPLTPATVALDRWPAVGWQMGDAPAVAIAQIISSDGTTYGVVPASLLGGHDFFLVSTDTGGRHDLVAAEAACARRVVCTWRRDVARVDRTADADVHRWRADAADRARRRGARQ